MLYAAELLEKMVVKFPGALRMRSIEPGEVDSNPLGAEYHGSCEGGRGVEVSRVGKARDNVANRDTDTSRVKNIFSSRGLRS